MSDEISAAKVSSKRAASGCGLLIILFLVLIGLVSMCSGDSKGPRTAEQRASTSLKTADPTITMVEANGEAMNIQVAMTTGWDGKAYVYSAGTLAMAVGKELQRGVSEDHPGLKFVNISYTVPGTDRLGNNVVIDFMNLSFNYADLKVANFDNLYSLGTLNLATEVTYGSRSGADALSEFCLDKENADLARAFCAKALG